MCVAAILVMWPGPFEQTFVLLSKGVSIWNLSLIGPVASEEMFENVDGRTTDGRREPSTEVSWQTKSDYNFCCKSDLVIGNFLIWINYF